MGGGWASWRAGDGLWLDRCASRSVVGGMKKTDRELEARIARTVRLNHMWSDSASPSCKTSHMLTATMFTIFTTGGELLKPMQPLFASARSLVR